MNKKIKCKYCDGTGSNPNAPLQTENKCGFLISSFPDCKFCNGTGYIANKEKTNE